MTELISRDGFWGESIQKKAVLFSFIDGELLWNLNSLRHSMLSRLGRDWADWDIEAAADNHPAAAAAGRAHKTFPVRVYLDGLRSPFNAGSVLRTSLAFGVEQCWFSPDGSSPDHRRARRSSMGAVDRIPWATKLLEELPDSLTGTLFAMELGGTDIADFEFPQSGTVIIGSEELGVSPSVLRRAENDGGIVSIPLPGPKASLNAGVAFGILLRQWIESIK